MLLFRLNTVLNAGPKIWNNLPKLINAQKHWANLREKLYRFLTHEYPSCTFEVKKWLLTFHMVKTNHQM